MSIEITDWLRGLGLEQYAAAFRDNDIDGEILRRLTAEDLRDMTARLGTLRERTGDGQWIDAPSASQTETDLENAILTKARQLRLSNING